MANAICTSLAPIHQSVGRHLLRGLIVFAMLLVSTVFSDESHAAEPRGVRNIVLVHGAFTDGSSWQDVIPLLQAKGYHVTAVQNPLTSLANDVEATRHVLERQQGGVLLVGHSWAGAIITEAGNFGNVRGLVYLSALVPDAGESVADLLTRQKAPMEGLAPDRNGYVWLDDPEAYSKVMAADVSPPRVAVLAATQQPMAAKSFGQKIGPKAAWEAKPSWYLVTEKDGALPLHVQQAIAKHIGATTRVIQSSHMSMVSHPEDVADFIASAAETLSDN